MKNTKYEIVVQNRFGKYVSNKKFKTRNEAIKITNYSRKADKSLSRRGLKSTGLLASEFKTKNQYRVRKVKP